MKCKQCGKEISFITVFFVTQGQYCEVCDTALLRIRHEKWQEKIEKRIEKIKKSERQ